MRLHVEVTDKEITAKHEADPPHGGEVIFRGLVRNTNHGRKVTALSYDSFVPLAEQTLKTIAQEASAKWGDDMNMTIVHRTGHLQIGDEAVIVVVSSKHRQEAFDACQYIIEELKVRAPIWKKEHYIDGESEWLQGHALCGHTRKQHAHEKHDHA